MRQTLPYFLCYLLWVITGALGFLNLIAARKLYLVILTILSVNPWAVRAADKFIFIFLGIIWLVLVIFSEYYYRDSVPKKRLWESFSLITGIQLLFLFLAHLIPPLMLGTKGLNWINYLLTGGELSGGIILLVFALHSSSCHSFRNWDLQRGKG